MKTDRKNYSVMIPLLLALLLTVSAPGEALAFTCKGKSGANACGGPTHGTCVGPDVCSCYTGWTGDECVIPNFCGVVSCLNCSSPNGVCDVLGVSGKCYCAPGRSGACCETLQSSGLLAPAGLDFGSVTVGATAPAQTSFTFMNSTTIPLTITNISLSGANSSDFAVVGGSCATGSAVTAGGSCSIITAFTPNAPGTRSALLTVTTGTATFPSAPSVFNTQVNVPLSTVIESNAVPLGSILPYGQSWKFTVDGGVLLINQNGTWVQLDTSLTYCFDSLQCSSVLDSASMVKVRQTSSSSYNTTVITSINVKGISSHFQYFKTTTQAGSAATLTGTGTIATSSIVIDPNTPTTLYAGLDGAGVYKSINSGGIWSEANGTAPNNLTNPRVKALVIKPGDSAKLYAATYGGGVYKSTNSGVDWSVCKDGSNVPNSGLTNLNLVSLTIDSIGKLYAGTEAGVFVSENDCANWTAMNTGLPN